MRFLFVDRIVELAPGEWVRGIKHITREDSCLCFDEAGRLCFVPSFIGEALGQLAAWNVMQHNQFRLRPVAGVVASAKLFRPAYVGETLLLESFIEQLDDEMVQYHSIAKIADEVVFKVEGALGPLLPMEEFISNEELQRQFNEINRPGDWQSFAICNEAVELSPNKGALPIIPAFSFDRILHLEPGAALEAEKRITRAAPYFPDHFPNKPVLPMTVLMECKLNLAREFLTYSAFSSHYQVSELRKIKMNGFVCPGDVIHCYLKVKEQDSQQLILSFRSEVDGRRVCILELVMTAKSD